MQINLKCVHCYKDLCYNLNWGEGNATIEISVLRCPCKEEIHGIGVHIVKEQDFNLLKDIIEKIEAKFNKDE